MSPDFKPSEIERAAQAAWTAADAYRVTEDASRPKFYACSMLPYPSGKLHMGHVRNYTINDMLTRQLRMKGMNVLMPMGWDAFGLPAENAAMKNKVPPAKWTYDNIAHMKGQMQAMGLAIDWSREIATCSPEYYRWNQWLFLKMLDAGIAERRTQVVNWDPVDQTVLANEQVIDGRGWRSGAPVEKREIPGYYLNITKYAEELLDHVQHKLPGWPERVKLMQENWIGRSEGVRFAFTHDIRGQDGQPIGDGRLYVFTTRADTIMGVTFVAVAPEHPLAAHAARSDAAVARLHRGMQVRRHHRGRARHAGEERRAHRPDGGASAVAREDRGLGRQLRAHRLRRRCGDGRARPRRARLRFRQEVRHRHPAGDPCRRRALQLRPLAGLVRRQGPRRHHQLRQLQRPEPHPRGGCGGEGPRPQGPGREEDHLAPARLGHQPPALLGHAHPDHPLPGARRRARAGEGPAGGAARAPDPGRQPAIRWRGTRSSSTCPARSAANRRKRETDTMDTFVDSSWYFMRYCDASNDRAMVGAGTQYWMPMDQYIGGIEHAILHLLYARFWTKVMRDLGLVKVDEPFTKLLTQGMVLNHIYSRKGAGGGVEYFWPHEVENTFDAEGRITGARLQSDGSAVTYEGVGTMSKSKNNGVDPQDLIDRYGADTARLFVMFASPPEQTLEWNDAGVEGANRFLKRLWNFGAKHGDAIRTAAAVDTGALDDAAKSLRFELHSVLRQISYDYERMQYNTVASGAMKLLNALEGFKGQSPAVLREGFGILLRALYPACPHTTWVLWKELGYEQALGDLLDAPWPAVDEGALQKDQIELMLQVNGKLRGAIKVPADADKAAIEALALASPDFEKFSQGMAVKKVVVVAGRLVNVVVG